MKWVVSKCSTCVKEFKGKGYMEFQCFKNNYEEQLPHQICKIKLIELLVKLYTFMMTKQHVICCMLIVI